MIIYTKGTFEQHIDHLHQVFTALRKANLKIKLKKCHFALPNIHFLGHVVGRDGIKPDPEKIDKVKNFPVPTNLTQLRGALGLFSYYRKFIKDFSRIAKPMLTLLKKDAPFIWGEKQQNAFDRLKEMLIKAPILSYPDFDKPFIIYTDASGIGLGAVLSQIKDDEKEHVIAYASRSLNPAEKNYSVTDQECLAVVWAIKHFQHYLGLKPFTIITDHIALKWLQTSKMPKGRRARWVMELQQYDFSIKHRPGKLNANADALSRTPASDEVEFSCFYMDIANNSENDSDDEMEEVIDTPQKVDKGKRKEETIHFPPCRNCGEFTCNGCYSNDFNVYDFYDYDCSPWTLSDSDETEAGYNMQHIYAQVTPYPNLEQETNDIIVKNVIEKQVIAGQPITRGGSRCTWDCDTENHHVHTYCKACKRNLPYGTTLHDCVIGFTLGKIRPEMNPQYLVNAPWWKEPLAVQQENTHSHYYELPYFNHTLYLSIPIPFDPLIAELD